MNVLGIESTAHTFGLGFIDCKDKKILFNEKIQFKDTDDGMDLRKLSDFHIAHFQELLGRFFLFLKEQSMSFSKDVDLISFSQGPGIGNALKIGALVAKTLAKKYDKDIVGVSHIKAHLEIGKMLTGFEDPMFLYVSGVNTQIIAKDEFGKYKIYGETEDIGMGNLFDSFARHIGLGFPGGPKIEKLARESTTFIELPYTIKGMNVSLAGMFSHLKRLVDQGDNKNDLCFSLQETCFALVMEVAERAMAYTNKKEFVIVGGVAANQRLATMAQEMCKLRGATYDSFPIQYAMDNGAMIAWQGYVDRERASKEIKGLHSEPYITVESDF